MTGEGRVTEWVGETRVGRGRPSKGLWVFFCVSWGHGQVLSTKVTQSDLTGYQGAQLGAGSYLGGHCHNVEG